MGCLSVNMVRVSGADMSFTREGGVSASFTKRGGMTAFFSPICAVDIRGRVVYLRDIDGKDLLDSNNMRLKTIKDI